MVLGDMHATYSTLVEKLSQRDLGSFVARRHRLLVAVVFAAESLVSLITLIRVSLPYVDEGWNANRSCALLNTGRPFGTMNSGVFERYPGSLRYCPLVASLIHAASISVLGLHLFTMRDVVFGPMLQNMPCDSADAIEPSVSLVSNRKGFAGGPEFWHL